MSTDKDTSADAAEESAPRKADEFGREIGERLSRARQGLSLSQQGIHTRTKLADPEKVGISRAVLSLYERGVNKPGAREIRLLCDVLKITPNWLLYGLEAPARPMQASSDWTRGSDG